ncbi:uncharacterized protein A1O5_10157 [Cladophialophora psammophila CBS 110553]|uniref:Fungal N-terminal domain-containing protein n=1 Tax=Cladophialophora psammophila CBS 110553 TaxID=1182543 RepID=W9WEY9_9EURO|nr:uncharacterized protein A1O5_10157 [Cladophialophora psammophila CBS 110553]EXJ66488.1 hypothetical protein A1O5_10157 [Cladophialophora psammophila CBS 110553]
MAETSTSSTKPKPSRDETHICSCAGNIAPVLDVAGAGFRLSLLLNAISSEVSNAGLEVKSISKGVTIFAMTLKHTGQVLQAPDSVHSQEAVETAKSIADESTRVFGEIKDMWMQASAQGADNTASPSLQQRFRRIFKKHRVTYLLAQLESLQLSLSVMLQVIQLGKVMASTSRSDSPDEVSVKKEMISQERAEAQNAVIVRYWQMSNMDMLFEASQREEEEDRNASLHSGTVRDNRASVVATDSSQHTVGALPPEYATSRALVRLPVFSLGELDHTLHQIRDSPRDMVQVSDRAIDPLLEKWTIWREIRERRHNRDSGSRYAPSVYNLDEDDEEIPFHERYQEREDSPRGYYLEGTTNDWRKPNSASARHEAFKRRKKYSGYQPSVSAASSDIEDSPGGSTSSKKGSSMRYVIDSGSESSDFESEMAQPKPQRRGSGSPVAERRRQVPGGDAPVAHTFTAPAHPPPWITANSTGGFHRPPSTQPSVGSAQSTASRLSSPAYHPPGHRPWATPDQNLTHHSVSSPLLPAHLPTAPNPFMPPQPLGFPRYGGQVLPQAHPQAHPQVQQHRYPQLATYTQPSRQTRHSSEISPQWSLAPRPVSQDGKSARSPSRSSQQGLPIRNHDEKRHSREKSTKHHIRESATKGLLGAGAIAGFLEALEGLSL